jgi:hypothetical protein
MVQDFFGEEEKSIIDWTQVEVYEKEGTKSGLSMALVECDKLLNHLLHLKGYKGKNIYERVASAKDAVHDIGGLAYALEIKENLLEEFDKDVSEKELHRAIEKYKESIRDIETSRVPESGIIDTIKRNLDYYFVTKPDQLRKWVLWFLVILVCFFVLDNTHIGQKIVHWISKMLGEVISWVWVLAILVGLILILTTIAMTISQRKKK